MMDTVIPIWGGCAGEAFFRRKFTLGENFSRAVVRIFADTGFELFLNGRPVAFVDEWNNTRDYDVTPFLQKGENLVAVHGLNHSGHRGFSFELCCGGRQVLVSDESWLEQIALKDAIRRLSERERHILPSTSFCGSAFSCPTIHSHTASSGSDG